MQIEILVSPAGGRTERSGREDAHPRLKSNSMNMSEKR
jgi:hypothetical protein